MAQSLEVIAVLANIEHGHNQNTILETLGKEISDFYVYKFSPEPGQYYASVNWRGVLGDVANLAAIATLIWTIYESKVKPELDKPDKGTTPAVIIQIKDKNNNFEQFRISGNYDSKEIFIRDFTHKVEILRNSNTNKEVFETFEKSERWIQIK
jgi:hypothetical protein